jgi:hypothetical protein
VTWRYTALGTEKEREGKEEKTKRSCDQHMDSRITARSAYSNGVRKGRKKGEERKKHAPTQIREQAPRTGVRDAGVVCAVLLLRHHGHGVVEREGDVACGAVLTRACGGQGRARGVREVCEVNLY